MAMIVRYSDKNGIRFGTLKGTEIFPLTGEFPDFDLSNEAPVRLEDVTLLAPVLPSKIIAIGPGYKAHLAGNPPPPRPYLWIKPLNTLLDPEGVIVLPAEPPMVCHESELAIVIGREARNVSPEEASDYIFGYTCINDVSAGLLTDMTAYLQSQYFVDGKTFDTFAPLGPAIATDIDPANVRIQCLVNGEIRQDHNSSDQIWKLPDLVSMISRRMTLYPGDVIGTGSPPRPGPLVPGDTVEVIIEGIGTLRNTVASQGG
jgi:2-keto-4-pentenoate hydratase/2-oxohepta-3-ene-1,7-dioic acid hydratase in catechol pathway